MICPLDANFLVSFSFVYLLYCSFGSFFVYSLCARIAFLLCFLNEFQLLIPPPPTIKPKKKKKIVETILW